MTRRLSFRRSRSLNPPQMPNRSSCANAYSRHSDRTSQPVQMRFASRVDPPFSGKKASGSVCAHKPRSCHSGASPESKSATTFTDTMPPRLSTDVTAGASYPPPWKAVETHPHTNYTRVMRAESSAHLIEKPVRRKPDCAAIASRCRRRFPRRHGTDGPSRAPRSTVACLRRYPWRAHPGQRQSRVFPLFHGTNRENFPTTQAPCCPR